jgi:very-short-patch-repair endonuclease
VIPRRINPRLATFARAMRAEPTPFENRLWQALRNRQLGGFKFSRQIVIDGFICDFVCRDRTRIVEVEGDIHDRAVDADRDYALGRLGYRVLRFTNAEVAGNLAGVLQAILEIVEGRAAKVERLEGRTHPPAPSLGREGEL